MIEETASVNICNQVLLGLQELSQATCSGFKVATRLTPLPCLRKA